MNSETRSTMLATITMILLTLGTIGVLGIGFIGVDTASPSFTGYVLLKMIVLTAWGLAGIGVGYAVSGVVSLLKNDDL